MTFRGPFVTRAKLILASGSPRRREFLNRLGLDFTVRESAVDENPGPGELPHDFVLRAAAEKAEAVSAKYPDCWVLGADTVVVLDDEILGKPAAAAEAERMLNLLAGRRHRVVTGFCLLHRSSGRSMRKAVQTEVLFAPFTGALASSYVQTGEPLDKAGSYGIQGIGGFLVREINGSYSNVVGLPLAEVVEALLEFGVIAPQTEKIE